ncbi:MAG: SpoVR family protein [Gammaproteobacteria bacterium RIFCSPHIGHO2_12_FULL_41_15]|nr:MAG: SpoVR family protein [Gammaproteobacteria bacterium RIFCSPHIGHO2_12_FULL_41_15]
MRKKPLSVGSDWTPELIMAYDKEISRLAADFGLDTFPNQIEIISAEQMMDAYAMTGMPIGYYHWTFGKHFVDIAQRYQRGEMGLAYEMVINSNPCIAYLMEENTMAMQALVIAHACYGHNSFFKNNYLFQMWTSPDAIIDYLVFARNFVAQCEEKHGITEVEALLDSCHALMNYGVDRYKHPQKLSIHEEKIRQQNREIYIQSQVNELWRTIPEKSAEKNAEKKKIFPQEPQENILYFIEKNAPLLEPWQREIVRIVRKLAQYFYPQPQTKIMNEGWATFWHYNLIYALYDEKLITDGFMLEVLDNHTNVITQLGFDHPHFTGINPYALGFRMYQEIKRICEAPTSEDKEWFPHLIGQDWRKAVDLAMRNFKDESFIAQYLSPKLIRDMKLFNVLDDDEKPDYIVSAIHNETGYKVIREALAKQYQLSAQDPNIQVYKVDIEGDRSLILQYTEYRRMNLDVSLNEVLKHLYFLWKFPIRLEVVDDNGVIVKTFSCPNKEI